MIVYQPVPLNRVQLGREFPVDVWSSDGRLLLRRGQVLQSESHRDTLARHQACMTESDAMAWQKSLERTMRRMRASGVDMLTIAAAPMPSDILEYDYMEGTQVKGDWLDLQDILRSLLYQGTDAIMPIVRLEGIAQKVTSLLKTDPDDSLFVLFQALPDLNLGYCATHALLCAAVCMLTMQKLEQPEDSMDTLLRAALLMNIGMAQSQNHLARQHKPPNKQQRQIIDEHPPISTNILGSFGLKDDALLHIVQWHHAPGAAPMHNEYATQMQMQLQLQLQLHLLHLADCQIAKLASRVSRPALSALRAAQSLVLTSPSQTTEMNSALVAVLSFYPPGTYVQLANGETAVVIQRGLRANAPHVASIINASGMPLSKYIYHDTSDTHAPQYAVRSPLASQTVRCLVNLEKIRHLRGVAIR
jgi:hypothetical protein